MISDGTAKMLALPDPAKLHEAHTRFPPARISRLSTRVGREPEPDNFKLRQLAGLCLPRMPAMSHRGGAVDSHFWDIYRVIRSVVQKPDDALYFLHTSIGVIRVHRFVYRGEEGFVIVQGTDESGKERIVGFSEKQLSTFPLEIQPRSVDKNGTIRFNGNLTETLL